MTDYLNRIENVWRKAMAVMAPPPKLKVSEWADRYRMLSAEASAEPGRWDTSRAEYQRDIMDAFVDPSIHTIVWMSSAQTGKTEQLLNIIGYFISQDPSPILMLQPTLEMAQTFSKDRLAPMIRDTKALHGLIDYKARASGNTILHKTFPGGHITMAGANSPASLASRPVRIVLCDEIDRYPPSAGAEGDPVNLAFKRSTTFWNKKRMLVSTPTIKGLSRIEMAYEESDKRKFHVPCPQCGKTQVLKWSNVVWENDDPFTAAYACEACGSLWSDAQRWGAVTKGRWIADRETNGVAGFWLNEIYSPWVKLSEMAANFLEAKKSPHTLKTFVNTSLGETWEEDQGEGVDDIDFSQHVSDYEKVPAKAAVLVAGVDVQDDRLEGEIKAFGEGEESWGIKPFVIHGSPALDSTWQQLEDIIFDEYDSELGVKLPVSCTCIDSGGHFTDEVYKFCKRHAMRRVYAVKGSSTPGKPIVSRPSTSNKYGVKLFMVGTDTAKELIYARLKIEEHSPGYYHFSDRYDAEYFAQLTAEKVVTRYHKGFQRREWVKTRARNEALDINVYALAAVRILNPNYKAVAHRHKNGINRPKRKKRRQTDNWGDII
ncbi:phage terminase large subunit family protein [Hydrogenimonas urashimensis]|uniref:phage terminase large subunit family protein n=1 Tax=Hydrogenimonas urashimensis TaxID=2740515 RepID=UPI0019156291|nr:phage terminase large subunit family protein [Hydrogenimonas urashimensis]